MRIAGLERCSLIDYPGKMAAVVFTPGCNLDCFYCHNRTLLAPSATFNAIPFPDVLDWLRKRQGLLDAVVISGGEPTLQADLDDFVREVRAMDYAVKLDTNGTRPAVLAFLIDEGLLDYIAMDIKAPPDKYESICGVPVDHNAIVTHIQDAEGPHGPTVRIDFTLTTNNEHDGRQVSGLASKKLSENTKLGTWIAAILGGVPEVGKEITAADLIRKECRVMIKHKTNADGQVFANVVGIRPGNVSE